MRLQLTLQLQATYFSTLQSPMVIHVGLVMQPHAHVNEGALNPTMCSKVWIFHWDGNAYQQLLHTVSSIGPHAKLSSVYTHWVVIKALLCIA